MNYANAPTMANLSLIVCVIDQSTSCLNNKNKILCKAEQLQTTLLL
jgi:hypothetical protein